VEVKGEILISFFLIYLIYYSLIKLLVTVLSPLPEQRLSNLTLSMLIGSTVLLAPVLQFIPLAVLYGVFLYIGVASLNSTQLFDRTALLFIPAKQHPPTIYVRRVSKNE